eukprot:scaffold68251_cov23-Tisochrysis_lutea.AAC.4
MAGYNKHPAFVMEPHTGLKRDCQNCRGGWFVGLLGLDSRMWKGTYKLLPPPEAVPDRHMYA